MRTERLQGIMQSTDLVIHGEHQAGAVVTGGGTTLAAKHEEAGGVAVIRTPASRMFSLYCSAASALEMAAVVLALAANAAAAVEELSMNLYASFQHPITALGIGLRMRAELLDL